MTLACRNDEEEEEVFRALLSCHVVWEGMRGGVSLRHDGHHHHDFWMEEGIIATGVLAADPLVAHETSDCCPLSSYACTTRNGERNGDTSPVRGSRPPCHALEWSIEGEGSAAEEGGGACVAFVLATHVKWVSPKVPWREERKKKSGPTALQWRVNKEDDPIPHTGGAKAAMKNVQKDSLHEEEDGGGSAVHNASSVGSHVCVRLPCRRTREGKDVPSWHSSFV